MIRMMLRFVAWLCDVQPPPPRPPDFGPPDVWPFCSATTHYFHGRAARCLCGARQSPWMPVDDLDARHA